jgi:hypothetical protein
MQRPGFPFRPPSDAYAAGDPTAAAFRGGARGGCAHVGRGQPRHGERGCGGHLQVVSFSREDGGPEEPRALGQRARCRER